MWLRPAHNRDRPHSARRGATQTIICPPRAVGSVAGHRQPACYSPRQAARRRAQRPLPCRAISVPGPARRHAPGPACGHPRQSPDDARHRRAGCRAHWPSTPLRPPSPARRRPRSAALAASWASRVSVRARSPSACNPSSRSRSSAVRCSASCAFPSAASARACAARRSASAASALASAARRPFSDASALDSARSARSRSRSRDSRRASDSTVGRSSNGCSNWCWTGVRDLIIASDGMSNWTGPNGSSFGLRRGHFRHIAI
jgi:hypothetical protein